MHQHTPSTGQPRSYTPNSFETRSYQPSPPIQSQQQQSMYPQPSRQSMASQPHQIRREPSHSELHHPLSGGYAPRTSTSEASVGLKQSPYASKEPYSATPPPRASQMARQQIPSPLDHAPPNDREYYSRQPQQYQMQQQTNNARSPTLGPFHQQQAQSHRQMAFGGPPHVPSPPPPQYASQMHRSRQNSFDGRFGGVSASERSSATSSAPPQQAYSQAPQHHGIPQMQYSQQQQHMGQDRFETPQDRERRQREEWRRQQIEDEMRRR